MELIEMRITTYNLCNDTLGEILGGEIQFTIDALTRILKEQEELLKSLEIDCFAIELLNTTNEWLKELSKKIDEDKDVDLDNAKEVETCFAVVDHINRFMQHFEWSCVFLKELKRKTMIFREKTNEEIKQLELLIESDFLKTVSKNFADGVFEKVNDRKKTLNEDIPKLESLIESALKKISKNYEDGLFDKVNERKKVLNEQIELLKKSNKR